MQKDDSHNIGTARLIAFHTPIIIIGGLIVLPILLRLLEHSDLAGIDEHLLEDFDYFRLMLLSLFMLAPTMFAFGNNLRFSPSRFLIAIAVLCFYVLRTLIQAGSSGPELVVLPIGGGIVGIALASGIGFGGLAVYDRYVAFSPYSQKALQIAVVCIGVFVGFFAISSLDNNQGLGDFGREYERPIIIDSPREEDLPPTWASGLWKCRSILTNADDKNEQWTSFLTIERITRNDYRWSTLREDSARNGATGEGYIDGLSFFMIVDSEREFEHRYSISTDSLRFSRENRNSEFPLDVVCARVIN